MRPSPCDGRCRARVLSLLWTPVCQQCLGWKLVSRLRRSRPSVAHDHGSEATNGDRGGADEWRRRLCWRGHRERSVLNLWHSNCFRHFALGVRTGPPSIRFSFQARGLALKNLMPHSLRRRRNPTTGDQSLQRVPEGPWEGTVPATGRRLDCSSSWATSSR